MLFFFWHWLRAGLKRPKHSQTRLALYLEGKAPQWSECLLLCAHILIIKLCYVTVVIQVTLYALISTRFLFPFLENLPTLLLCCTWSLAQCKHFTLPLKRVLKEQHSNYTQVIFTETVTGECNKHILYRSACRQVKTGIKQTNQRKPFASCILQWFYFFGNSEIVGMDR